MTKRLLFLPFLLLSIIVFGQSPGHKHSFTIELIPWAQQFSYANGINFQYGIEMGRFLNSVSLGFNYSDYQSGFSFEIGPLNSSELEGSTSIDYRVEESFPFLSPMEYKELQNFGFYQYETEPDYRFNRFLNYELMYKIFDNKFRVYAGAGLSLGLTNRMYTIYAMQGEIIGKYDGSSEGDYFIAFNARAKYLYWGPTGKFIVDYALTEQFNVGISTGFQLPLNKVFASDDAYYYLGIRAKAEF